jgi:hypothetical protein
VLNAGLTPGGDFRLQLWGDPGRAYVIETSANLGQWWPASTNLTGLAGSLVITNTVDGNIPAQFYRAQLAQ